jgi:hypothetical protein
LGEVFSGSDPLGVESDLFIEGSFPSKFIVMLLLTFLFVHYEDRIDVAFNSVIDEIEFIFGILNQHLPEDAPHLIYILGAVGSGLLKEFIVPRSDSESFPQHVLYLAPSTVMFRQCVEVIANLSAVKGASH